MLTRFTVVCFAFAALVSTSTQAANNDEAINKPPQIPVQGPGGNQRPQVPRQLNPFSTEGTVLPQPQQLIPGYPDDGIQGFNPYASPQYGFNGYYPLQPQQPQGYPGQPQIVYYSGTGQPFLVNPGNPPGNFLIPQVPQYPQQPGQPIDPSIFNTQPVYPPLQPPQNPGFPKQPVVPPIDKDAEEIPKDIPMQGVASNVPKKQKPQKIELDESEDVEGDKAVKPQSPQVPPAQQPQSGPGVGNVPNIPNIPNVGNLHPGQRFFILNGQPLFSNYPGPGFGYQHPNLVPERYVNPYIARPHQQQFYQQPQRPHHQPLDQQQFKPLSSSLASIILRNQPQLVRQHLIPNHLKGHNFPQQSDGLPITLHNQVVDNKNLHSVLLTPATKDGLQSRYYEKTIPFDEQQIPLQQDQVQPVFGADAPAINFDYYKYNDAVDSDDAAVIIDAKYQEPNEVDDGESEDDTEKPAESSVAEAQPSAVALAGDGGVAAAGPRGTALAGEGGLAVSSPHATAVAGPAKDDAPVETNENKVKPTTTPTKSK